MNKNEYKSKIAQWIAFAAQCYVLIAIVIMALIIEDRIVICFYYRLPIIYNSMDIIRAVPMISFVFIFAAIFFRFIYEMLGCILLFEKEKKNFTSAENSKDNTMEIAKLWNKCFVRGLIPNFFLKAAIFIDKKVERLAVNKKKKDDSEDKINISNSLRSLMQSIAIEIALVLLGTMTDNTLWKSLTGVMIVIVIFFEVWFLLSCFIGIIAETSNLLQSDSKKEKKMDTDLAIKNMESYQIKFQIIEYCILVFFAVSSWVVTGRVITLNDNTNYGIVENVNAVNTQEYAVILDLEDYFVLLPTEEKQDELIIKTGQYMYKSKDNTLVTQKRYGFITIQ